MMGVAVSLYFFLHASLPVSLANVMISDLIREPRGLTDQLYSRPAGALYRRVFARHAPVVMYTSRVTAHFI